MHVIPNLVIILQNMYVYLLKKNAYNMWYAGFKVTNLVTH